MWKPCMKKKLQIKKKKIHYVKNWYKRKKIQAVINPKSYTSYIYGRVVNKVGLYHVYIYMREWLIK